MKPRSFCLNADREANFPLCNHKADPSQRKTRNPRPLSSTFLVLMNC
jgi:hypothetical protein